MKTNITLLIAMLPFCAIAQTTVVNAEYYNIGDVIQVQNASGSGSANPDTSGAGQTWNFSGLSAIGNAITLTVQSNSGSASFPNANIVVASSTGSKQYIKETSTDSYVLGVVDNATSDSVDYNNGIHIEERPFGYMSNYIDSYRVITATIRGTGYITVTGDSYGMLTLPSGTYDALRIKRSIAETDTALSDNSISAVGTVSYLWFDNVHSAPLLRIDTVNSSLNPTTVSVQYLAMPLGINNVSNSTHNFVAAFNNDALVINGSFEQNKPYETAVYDITGQEIFKSTFTALGNIMQFDTNRQLSAGMYVVRLVNTNDGSVNVIKVVKR